MRRPVTALFPLLILAAACGPADRTSETVPAVDAGAGDGEDPNEGNVTLTGTVWAPGNAPGMVPPGHEIPVSGAVVYVALDRPEPISQTVECVPCTEAPASGVVTDAKGNFVLSVAPGTYWLVVQKAQFRLEQQLVITPQTVLTHEQTTLPSLHDPDNGMWIPRIALVLGYSGDPMETILGKMGIGEVDASGAFIATSAAGKFDLYEAGSRSLAGAMPVETLVKDLDKMLQYHIIFFPCAVGDRDELLAQSDVQRNIRDYVAMGGRMYVADWAGDWADNIFPEQIQLAGTTYDTPATAYDRAADIWFPAQFGNANAFPSYTSFASISEPGLAEWLDGQMGAGGEISAEAIQVVGNYNRIFDLHEVEIGTDMMGQPVIDAPVTYVSGTAPGWDNEIKPLMATYEPVGCGRVMYSTFHTTSDEHVGLLPQERVLLYLLLEIGVCKDDPVVE
ncbi:MAG TPA: carboxypeptidase-like regulatory domain-containing protein [Kofleriaceae bacterium]|nr:carboxypeptidase-like regulatory domain-containing protein [Kofleriaceae bacterium]